MMQPSRADRLTELYETIETRKRGAAANVQATPPAYREAKHVDEKDHPVDVMHFETNPRHKDLFGLGCELPSLGSGPNRPSPIAAAMLSSDQKAGSEADLACSKPLAVGLVP